MTIAKTASTTLAAAFSCSAKITDTAEAYDGDEMNFRNWLPRSLVNLSISDVGDTSPPRSAPIVSPAALISLQTRT